MIEGSFARARCGPEGPCGGGGCGGVGGTRVMRKLHGGRRWGLGHGRGEGGRQLRGRVTQPSACADLARWRTAGPVAKDRKRRGQDQGVGVHQIVTLVSVEASNRLPDHYYRA